MSDRCGVLKRVVVVLLATLAVACNGDGDGAADTAGAGAGGTSVPAPVRALLDKHCATVGCHNTNAPILTQGKAHDATVGKVSLSCDGQLLVDPGKPAVSCFIRRMKEKIGVYPRMPTLKPKLPDDEIKVFEDWIAGLPTKVTGT